MTERHVAQDDVNLVRRAQAGDQEAFAELFKRLHQPILNYAYRMLGDRGAAEDITQDAFIRAHQHLGRLGPPYDFKSWIYRIAGNLSLNLLKREKRLVQVDEFDEFGEPHTDRRPAEDKVRREEARESVWKTLDSIPTLYRQVLILREFNQFSYEEISRVLQRSYDSVRQLVHRARVRFQEVHIGRLMLVEGPARCTELGDLISAYRDDELQADERRAVMAHIASCADCQATERDLRKVAAALGMIPPIIPSKGWTTGVLNRIFQGESPVSEPDPSQVETTVESEPRTRVEPEPGSSPEHAEPTRPTPFPRDLIMPFALMGAGGLGLIIATSLFFFVYFGGTPPAGPLFSRETPTAVHEVLPTESPDVTPAPTKDEGDESVLSSDMDTTPTVTSTATDTPSGVEPRSITPTFTHTPSPTFTRTPTPTFTPTNTPTPTPTNTPIPAPPAAPSKLVISARVCSDMEYSVTLSWTDNANNEDGFRVYRGKLLIATLKANTTTYKDNPPYTGPYTYGVEAYNDAGSSSRPTVYEEGCMY
ncbi:MAG: sigma-70 family RNA polymerase sigma factor [Anaerolineales bacterium]|nr:sigma-70 family RNA polymerase sigma factor [Anaerolineales bacterium]